MRRGIVVLVFSVFIAFVGVAANDCLQDADCEAGLKCDGGLCQASHVRVSRGIQGCFHDGHCLSRYRCIVFFCVYVGPDDIPQRIEPQDLVVKSAPVNQTDGPESSKTIDN